jgi:hypothetical protein
VAERDLQLLRRLRGTGNRPIPVSVLRPARNPDFHSFAVRPRRPLLRPDESDVLI